jgi:hypothetical protein
MEEREKDKTESKKVINMQKDGRRRTDPSE